jgi:hypothetical protein
MSTVLHPSVLLGQVIADADLDPEIEENLTPGWVGALVIIGLIVITVLLWLSMRRQFRKIRFEEDRSADDATPAAGEDDRP